MAEDKYFGIAPENAADAETQRAKHRRLRKMMESMLEDEEMAEMTSDGKMLSEVAKNLQDITTVIRNNVEGYICGKQPNAKLALLAMMHAELDLNILHGYLDDDFDDEDDDLDDLPYGWDGPMPWDEEEEDEPDTFRERMESLCEKKLTDEDCGECALLFPIPCTKNMPQVTVKDWFAKFDEEANEWKQEILRHADLDDPIEKLRKFYEVPENKLDGNVNNKYFISEEGADVMTVIASVEEKIGLDADARADAQLHVNQHNKERGRW